jgi:hypothetical protein
VQALRHRRTHSVDVVKENHQFWLTTKRADKHRRRSLTRYECNERDASITTHLANMTEHIGCNARYEEEPTEHALRMSIQGVDRGRSSQPTPSHVGGCHRHETARGSAGKYKSTKYREIGLTEATGP